MYLHYYYLCTTTAAAVLILKIYTAAVCGVFACNVNDVNIKHSSSYPSTDTSLTLLPKVQTDGVFTNMCVHRIAKRGNIQPGKRVLVFRNGMHGA